MNTRQSLKQLTVHPLSQAIQTMREKSKAVIGHTRKALQLSMTGSVMATGLLSSSWVWSDPSQSGSDLSGVKGGRVLSGQGEILKNGQHTQINQHSQNLGLSFDQFNIKVGESVHFEQPNSQAIAISKILDQSPSEIFGQLSATGQIVLVNPHGIVFGETARIDVAALVASGIDLDIDQLTRLNQDQRGVLSELILSQLDTNGQPGAIINRGMINAATGGSVSLVGGQVTNEGIIQAELGYIQLEAGRTATLSFDQDQKIGVLVTEQIITNALEEKSAVLNTGTLMADGGQVFLKGRISRDAFDSAVNNQGIIKAGRIENKNGKIMLAGIGGDVVNSGTINADGGKISLIGQNVTQAGSVDVSSREQRAGDILIKADETQGTALILADLEQHPASLTATGQQGGQITVLGHQVGVGHAQIDASGGSQGGDIRIGGELRGEGELPTSSQTIITQHATVKADALEHGKGGNIIFWSDEYTRFSGQVSATGGDQGGDGGFIEISSLGGLVSEGEIDLTAENGRVGTVLFDPLNIIITGGTGDGEDSDSNDNRLRVSGDQDGQVSFDNTVGGPRDLVIRESEIEQTNANIILEARNSITVTETFNNNDVVLRNNRNLVLRTSNVSGASGENPGDSIPGIHLGNILFKTTGSGSILIQTGVLGGIDNPDGLGSTISTVNSELADISLGNLQSDNGSITIIGNNKITISRTTSSSGDITLDAANTIDILNNIRSNNRGDISIKTNLGTIFTKGKIFAKNGSINLETPNQISTFNSIITEKGNITLIASQGDILTRDIISTEDGSIFLNSPEINVQGDLLADVGGIRIAGELNINEFDVSNTFGLQQIKSDQAILILDDVNVFPNIPDAVDVTIQSEENNIIFDGLISNMDNRINASFTLFAPNVNSETETGNIILNAGANLAKDINFQGGGTVVLQGTFNLSEGLSNTQSITQIQGISTLTGTGPLEFSDLQLSADQLTLNLSASVRDTLTFDGVASLITGSGAITNLNGSALTTTASPSQELTLDVPLTTHNLILDSVADSTGSITFNKPLNVNNTLTFGTDPQNYALNILGGGRIAGKTIIKNTGDLILDTSTDPDLSLVFVDGLINNSSDTQLAGAIKTESADAPIELGKTVTLTANTTLTTDQGDIILNSLQSSLDDQGTPFNLSLDGGTTDPATTTAFTITNMLSSIGDLIVKNAQNINLLGSIQAVSINVQNIIGNVRIGNDVPEQQDPDQPVISSTINVSGHLTTDQSSFNLTLEGQGTIAGTTTLTNQGNVSLIALDNPDTANTLEGLVFLQGLDTQGIITDITADIDANDINTPRTFIQGSISVLDATQNTLNLGITELTGDTQLRAGIIDLGLDQVPDSVRSSQPFALTLTTANTNPLPSGRSIIRLGTSDLPNPQDPDQIVLFINQAILSRFKEGFSQITLGDTQTDYTIDLGDPASSPLATVTSLDFKDDLRILTSDHGIINLNQSLTTTGDNITLSGTVSVADTMTHSDLTSSPIIRLDTTMGGETTGGTIHLSGALKGQAMQGKLALNAGTENDINISANLSLAADDHRVHTLEITNSRTTTFDGTTTLSLNTLAIQDSQNTVTISSALDIQTAFIVKNQEADPGYALNLATQGRIAGKTQFNNGGLLTINTFNQQPGNTEPGVLIFERGFDASSVTTHLQGILKTETQGADNNIQLGGTLLTGNTILIADQIAVVGDTNSIAADQANIELTLAPFSSTGQLLITSAQAMATTPTISLDADGAGEELAHEFFTGTLAEGLGLLTLGRGDADLTIDVGSAENSGAVSFNTSIQLRTSSKGQITTQAELNTLASTDAARIALNASSINSMDQTESLGLITLANHLNTEGGTIQLNGHVEIASQPVTIDTTNGSTQGANITFNGLLDATDQNTQAHLTLNSGSDNGLIFDSHLGSKQRLNTITITNSKSVAFNQGIDLDQLTVANIEDALTINGSINLGDQNDTANALDLNAAELNTDGYSVTLKGQGQIAGLTQFNNKGTITLNAQDDIATTETEGLDFIHGLDTTSAAPSTQLTQLSGLITTSGRFSPGNPGITLGDTQLIGDTTLKTHHIDLGLGEVGQVNSAQGQHSLTLTAVTDANLLGNPSTVLIGVTDDNTHALFIQQAIVDRLKEGFSQITIGDQEQAFTIQIGETTDTSFTFKDAVSFLSSSQGSITVNAALTTDQPINMDPQLDTGALILSSQSNDGTLGSILLNNHLSTSGSAIKLDGNLIIGARVDSQGMSQPIDIDTTQSNQSAGGAINISGSLGAAPGTANSQLRLNAGTDNDLAIQLSETTNSLDTLTIANSQTTTINGDTIQLAKLVINDTQSKILIGNNTVDAGQENQSHIDITQSLIFNNLNPDPDNAYQVELIGTGTIAGQTQFNNQGEVILNTDLGTGLTFTDGITIDTGATLSGLIKTENSAFNFGAVTLSDDTQLVSTTTGAGATGANISFTSIAGNKALTLDAGREGDISVALTVGTVDQALHSLNVTDTNNITLKNLFTDALTVVTQAQGSLTLNGQGIIGGNTDLNSVQGAVTLTTDLSTGLTFSDGLTITQESTINPGINLSGTIKTLNGAINLGDITLTGAVMLSSASADMQTDANITVQSVEGSAPLLTLDAGVTGNISITDNIGSFNTPLTRLTINNANDIQLNNVFVDALTVTKAQGQLSITDAAVIGGVTDLSSVTDGVRLSSAMGQQLDFKGGVITTTTTQLAGGILSSQGALSFAETVLTANTTLTTTNQNIHLGSITGQSQDLTINAGAMGTIAVSGDTQVQNLTLVNSHTSQLMGSVTAAILTITDAQTNVQIGGSQQSALMITTLNTQVSDDTINPSGYTLTLAGQGTIGGATTFNNRGSVTLQSDHDEGLTFNEGLTVTENTTSISGLIATHFNHISLEAVTLLGDSALTAGSNDPGNTNSTITTLGIIGQGHSISLTSGSHITTQNIDTHGQDTMGQSGGNVNITSMDGIISVGAINTQGGQGSNINGGHGGSVEINTNNNINLATILTSGGTSQGQTGGDAGNIIINSGVGANSGTIAFAPNSIAQGTCQIVSICAIGGSGLGNESRGGLGGNLDISTGSNLIFPSVNLQAADNPRDLPMERDRAAGTLTALVDSITIDPAALTTASTGNIAIRAQNSIAINGDLAIQPATGEELSLVRLTAGLSGNASTINLRNITGAQTELVLDAGVNGTITTGTIGALGSELSSVQIFNSNTTHINAIHTDQLSVENTQTSVQIGTDNTSAINIKNALVLGGELINPNFEITIIGQGTIGGGTYFNNGQAVVLRSDNVTGLTFADGLVSTGATTDLAGLIKTGKGAIILGEATLSATTNLQSQGNNADITIASLSGGNSIDLRSDNNTITITGDINLTDRNISFRQNNQINLQGSVNASVLSINDMNDNGSVTINGQLTLNTLTTENQNYALSILGGGTIAQETTLNNLGGLKLNQSDDQVLTFTRGLNVTNAPSIELRGTVQTGLPTTTNTITNPDGTTQTTTKPIALNLKDTLLIGHTTLIADQIVIPTVAKSAQALGGVSLTLSTFSNEGTITLMGSASAPQLQFTASAPGSSASDFFSGDIGEGLDSLTIGRQHDTFNTDITVSGADPVSFKDSLHLITAGDINLNQALDTLSSSDGASIELRASRINLANDLTANGAGIEIHGAVNVSGNSNVKLELPQSQALMAGTAIVVHSAVSGVGALTLNATDQGDIALNGSVGTALDSLNSLTIANSHSTAFQGAVNVGTLNLMDSQSAIDFNEQANINTLTTTDQGYRLAFNNGGTISNTVALLNTGGVLLNGGGSGLTFASGLVSNVSTTTLAGGAIQSTTGNITLGSVELMGSSTVDASSNTLNINSIVRSENNNNQTITLHAQDIHVSGDIGIDNVNIATVSLNASGAGTVIGQVFADTLNITNNAQFNGAVDVEVVAIQGAQGNVAFNGLVTLNEIQTQENQGQTISLLGGGTVAKTANFHNTGGVVLGGGEGGLTFTNGLSSTATTTTLQGGTVSASASGISLADVMLIAGTTLESNQNIVLESVQGSGQDLTITAENLHISQAVGSNAGQLGVLTINVSDTAQLMGGTIVDTLSVDAKHLMVANGLGAGSTQSTIADISTSENITLSGGLFAETATITAQGDVQLTGGVNGQTISVNANNLTVSGPLGSDAAHITTLTVNTQSNADVTGQVFVNQATITAEGDVKMIGNITAKNLSAQANNITIGDTVNLNTLNTEVLTLNAMMDTVVNSGVTAGSIHIFNNATFNSTVDALAANIQGEQGTIIFNGAIQLGQLLTQGFNAMGGSIIQNQNISILGGGSIADNTQFNNRGTVRINDTTEDTFTFSGGVDLSNAQGVLDIQGTIKTGQGELILGNQVRLQGDTNVQTTDANISFQGFQGNQHSLTLDSGTGDIILNGLNSNSGLGALKVIQSRQTTLSGGEGANTITLGALDIQGTQTFALDLQSDQTLSIANDVTIETNNTQLSGTLTSTTGAIDLGSIESGGVISLTGGAKLIAQTGITINDQVNAQDQILTVGLGDTDTDEAGNRAVVQFNEQVTLSNLMTEQGNYAIELNNDAQFAQHVVFINTGGVHLQTQADGFNFTQGFTSTASPTTLSGSIRATSGNIHLEKTTILGLAQISLGGSGQLDLGQTDHVGSGSLSIQAGNDALVNFNGSVNLTALSTSNPEGGDQQYTVNLNQGANIDGEAKFAHQGTLLLNGREQALNFNGGLTVEPSINTVRLAGVMNFAQDVSIQAGEISSALAAGEDRQSLTLSGNNQSTITLEGVLDLGLLVTEAQPYNIVLKGQGNIEGRSVLMNQGALTLARSNSDGPDAGINFSNGLDARGVTVNLAHNIQSDSGSLDFATINLDGHSQLGQESTSVNISISRVQGTGQDFTIYADQAQLLGSIGQGTGALGELSVAANELQLGSATGAMNIDAHEVTLVAQNQILLMSDAQLKSGGGGISVQGNINSQGNQSLMLASLGQVSLARTDTGAIAEVNIAGLTIDSQQQVIIAMDAITTTNGDLSITGNSVQLGLESIGGLDLVANGAASIGISGNTTLQSKVTAIANGDGDIQWSELNSSNGSDLTSSTNTGKTRLAGNVTGLGMFEINGSALFEHENTAIESQTINVQALALNSNLIMANDVSIGVETGVSLESIDGVVDRQQGLTLGAATHGTIAINGPVGEQVALKGLTIVGALESTFNNNIKAETINLTSDTIRFNDDSAQGSLDVGLSGGSTTIQSLAQINNDVRFINTNGTLILSAVESGGAMARLEIAKGATDVTLGAIGTSQARLTSVLVDEAQNLTLTGDINSGTGGLDIRATQVRMINDIALSTENSDINLRVRDASDEAAASSGFITGFDQRFSIDAGDLGNVFLDLQVGGENQLLSAFTVSNANSVSLNQDIFAREVTITAKDSLTQIGTVNASSKISFEAGSSGVSLEGKLLSLGEGINIGSDDNDITITSTGDITGLVSNFTNSIDNFDISGVNIFISAPNSSVGTFERPLVISANRLVIDAREIFDQTFFSVADFVPIQANSLRTSAASFGNSGASSSQREQLDSLIELDPAIFGQIAPVTTNSESVALPCDQAEEEDVCQENS